MTGRGGERGGGEMGEGVERTPTLSEELAELRKLFTVEQANAFLDETRREQAIADAERALIDAAMAWYATGYEDAKWKLAGACADLEAARAR